LAHKSYSEHRQIIWAVSERQRRRLTERPCIASQYPFSREREGTSLRFAQSPTA
jgi:hypothetical protein